MEGKRFLIAGLVSFIIMTGLLLISCDILKTKCPGNGECTVTIDQGTAGLYVDYDSPRSSCGRSRTYNYDTGNYTSGCKVQDTMDGYGRTFGTKGCDCGN